MEGDMNFCVRTSRTLGLQDTRISSAYQHRRGEVRGHALLITPLLPQ